MKRNRKASWLSLTPFLRIPGYLKTSILILFILLVCIFLQVIGMRN